MDPISEIYAQLLIEANIINPEKISGFTRSILGNFLLNQHIDHTDLPEEIFKWVDTKLVKYFIQHPHMLPLTDYTPTENDPKWMQGKTDLVQMNPSLTTGGLVDEFRRAYNQIYQDIMHVFDWMMSLGGQEISKLDRITFEQAHEHAQRWVDELNRKAKDEEDWSNVETIMEWPDGFKIVRIKGNVCLEREGKLMGHCVGGGGYDTEYINIYSLRDPNNNPHVTIETVAETEHPSSDHVVNQIKGKENKAPIDKYKPYVREFINKLDLEVLDDGRNIGFVPWDYKWYDPEGDRWKQIYRQKVIPRQKEAIQRVMLRIEDGVINGNVDFDELFLTELPDLSNITVMGDFLCAQNNLTSLKGAPRKVGKRFFCGFNLLTSLQGAPEQIGEDFYCNNNQLTSLEGSPKSVPRTFHCSHNQLTSLEGGPEQVGKYYCNYNRLTSLRGSPKVIKYAFHCSNNNLTSLEGGPEQVVDGSFFCNSTQLTSLKGAPKRVGSSFLASHNQLTSLEGSPKEVGNTFKVKANPLKSLKGAPLRIGGDFLSDQFSDSEYREYIKKQEEENPKSTSFKDFYDSQS